MAAFKLSLSMVSPPPNSPWNPPCSKIIRWRVESRLVFFGVGAARAPLGCDTVRGHSRVSTVHTHTPLRHGIVVRRCVTETEPWPAGADRQAGAAGGEERALRRPPRRPRAPP
eukprot:889477-Rhodomonas_salina.1